MEEKQGFDGRGDAARSGDRSSRRRDAVRRAVADPAEVARLFSALPPSAPEAEMSLLGAMIVDPKVISDVIGIVSQPDDFAKAGHGTIFQHMLALYDSTATLEIVSLVQRLKDHGVLEDVGGSTYLMDLAEGVATAANAAEYARLVREKATLRELIRAAGEILVDAHQSRQDPVLTLGEAEARIFAIAQRREARAASALRDILQETIRTLDRNAGKHVTGVPTGFDELDEMLSGLQRGEMVILAARPSMGKTAFALNITENMASSSGGVAFFSLEMGRQQLVQRILCAKGNVDGQKLRKNMLSRDEWQRIMGACDSLNEVPIFIDDTPGLTLLQMRSKARRMKEKHGIEAIVIDYLQLMSSGTRVESRQVEVSEISRGVKAMARELDVPVVCLSQLNRQAEGREGHRPRMSDLRESGSIEQDADVVMMLHREAYYHKQDPNWEEANPNRANIAEVIVAKQRNGPTGTVELLWDSRTTAFRNLSPQGASRGVEYAGRGDGGGEYGDIPA
jgi:replicative DNA helicase